jgi:hypothetical protein
MAIRLSEEKVTLKSRDCLRLSKKNGNPKNKNVITAESI